MGHIELCVPVYNPTMFMLMYKVLRLKCFACHRLRIAASRARLLKVKLMLLDLGRFEEAMALDARIAARPVEDIITEIGGLGPNATRRAGAGAAKRSKAAATAAAASKRRAAKTGTAGGSEEADAAAASEPMPEDAAEESVESALARQDKLLSDLETDCLAAGGPDVGLGLLNAGHRTAGGAGASGNPMATQHIREYRDLLIKEFLASFPAKVCHNCTAAAVPIKKDGYSKLFLKPLSRRTLAAAASAGITYRSATAILRERGRLQRAALRKLRARRARRQAAAAAAEAGEEEEEAAAEAAATAGGPEGGEGEGAEDDDGEEEDELGLFGVTLNAIEGGADADDDAGDAAAGGRQRYMAASEVAGHMQLLWETESEVLRRVFLPIRAAPFAADGCTPLPGATVAGAAAGAAQGVGLRSLLPRPHSRATLADLQAGRAARGGGGVVAAAGAAHAGGGALQHPGAVTSLAVKVDHAGGYRPSFSLHTPGFLPLPAAAAGVAAAAGGARSGASASTTSVGLLRPHDGWRFFFLRVVPVPPSRFRPPQVLNEQQYEHPQNVYLTKILKANDTLLDLGLGRGGAAARAGAAAASAAAASGAGAAPMDLRRAIATWMDLQNSVNGLLDSTKATSAKGTALPNGIRQLLEKKEGMMRKNLMGKRVNYAARSVISPDPFLRTDQVGVPVRFAKTLTFKQPVTRFNVRLLAALVRNGPSTWPGASHVELEDGTVIDLAHQNAKQREGLARLLLVPPEARPGSLPGAGGRLTGGAAGGLGSIGVDTAAAGAAAASGGLGGVGARRVWRHCLDDDVVLMNRQPTLHKPSIMAHRTRIMRGAWSEQQTIRFHYANCKTYNADFDGDEVREAVPRCGGAGGGGGGGVGLLRLAGGVERCRGCDCDCCSCRAAEP
jgi:DNA-directed RNA polymerase beta' subunit